MGVYDRATCPICGRWYQLRSGSMVFVLVAEGKAPPLICFLCVRKLKQLGILSNATEIKQEENTKRIVEI